MAMIPDSFIQDLLARVDVVDVVGQYVKLRKGGINLLGLCPFHQEKSPSFTVSPSKQFYHCFGCGAHGTAIRFLMDHVGMNFPAAVRQLADSVGLRIPLAPSSPEQRVAYAQKKAVVSRHTEVLDKAQVFYKQNLKQASSAIQYLKSRGLTGQTAARFGLGWSGLERTGLAQVFDHYEDDLLVESGLVVLTEDGRRYDRFRERIMFPIRNARGHLIGFGGRLIAKGEPKYLNSPETPVFSKGEELYGLWEARAGIRQARQVVVVEGYMDVVMLAQAGIDCAVATLGTATTSKHIQKLLRVTDNIVFCFDGDSAGQKAAWRALESSLEWLRDDISLRFMFLPNQHDPDSYVNEHGAEPFLIQSKEAPTLSQYLLSELRLRYDLEQAEGRAKCLHEVKPLIQKIPKIMLRTQIIHEMANLVLLTSDELTQFLDLDYEHERAPASTRQENYIGINERVQKNEALSAIDEPPHWHDLGGYDETFGVEQSLSSFASLPVTKKNRSYAAPFRRRTVESLEQRLLRLLLTHPYLISQLLPEQRDLINSMPELQEIRQLISLVERCGAVHSAAIIEASHTDPALQQALSQVMATAMMEEELPNPFEELSDAMRMFTLRFLTRHQDELAAQGLHTEESKQMYRRLMVKINELRTLKGNSD